MREFGVYETERGVKMADGEAEAENGSCPDLAAEMPRLEERLRELEGQLRVAGAGGGEDEAVQAASEYCQRFCQVRGLGEGSRRGFVERPSLPVMGTAGFPVFVMVEGELGGITGFFVCLHAPYKCRGLSPPVQPRAVSSFQAGMYSHCTVPAA